MLINTPDGWRSLRGHPAPELRQATTFREVSAKMADELSALCPSLDRADVSRMASQFAGAVLGPMARV